MKLSKQRIEEKLKLEKYFELEKDQSFPNSLCFKNNVKNKYDLNDKECSELYIKIVNYQVKKYGQNITKDFRFKR